jgi:hypothetical protein
MDAGGIFDLGVHLNNRDIFINIKSAGSQRLLLLQKGTGSCERKEALYKN